MTRGDTPLRASTWLAGLAAVAIVACAAAARLLPAQERASLIVSDVTLIDGKGGAPREHVSLVIRDGRIAAVIAAGAGVPGEGAEVTIDGRGLFAIPGLWDSHVHLGSESWERETATLRDALRGGVTSVVDMAGDTRSTGALARAVLAGEIQGPTIYYSALIAGPPFFTDPRAVGASLGFRPGEAPWQQAITDGTDVAGAVARARGTGATVHKLYAALDAAAARRVVAEGRRQGMRVVAHATVFPARPGELVAAGVHMLAHAPYLVWEGSPPTADFTRRGRGDFVGVAAESPAIERLLAAMRDSGVALNPTLRVFAESTPPDSLTRARTPWMNAVTRRAAVLGVPIVAGTDGLLDRRDSLPGIHRELELLVAAGLTPLQALQSATRNAARVLGVEGERGTLEPGRAADLLLLGGDPTADIRNTRRIRHVLRAGRMVERH